jgi:hypothetical protein
MERPEIVGKSNIWGRMERITWWVTVSVVLKWTCKIFSESFPSPPLNALSHM